MIKLYADDVYSLFVIHFLIQGMLEEYKPEDVDIKMYFSEEELKHVYEVTINLEKYEQTGIKSVFSAEPKLFKKR
jgi:hypothetical protein